MAKQLADDRRIYKIMPLDYAAAMFRTGRLHFSHPSTWNDPYEKFVVHPKTHAIFAQCWSRKPVSDALWRLFSPDEKSVRISTTVGNLKAAIAQACVLKGYKSTSGLVGYEKTADLLAKAEALVARLDRNFRPRLAADLLFMKRWAYSFEGEWRAVVYWPEAEPRAAADGLKLDVDAGSLFGRVVLDPRLSKAEMRRQAAVLRDAGFAGRIAPSPLYTAPPVLTVPAKLPRAPQGA